MSDTKTNDPGVMTISMQVALEEEVERLAAAEKASKNRILYLAQSNANLKARLAELEAELATLPAEAPVGKQKAN
ncbi:hypothetical protein [Mesorhizobium sp. ESP-6-2]|uniref:hypothetical protein n=1 Tax=Mesorhizobium sp. ESP-6-2 TaxID=2876625 RepID=UPI001CCF94D1|nr:hypothetical protein [Mesorhizobium sp. ESP-6-2]MBZ9808116.1 hypothetical protein [Mesorhizobium sp. ESP-6-2]